MNMETEHVSPSPPLHARRRRSSSVSFSMSAPMSPLHSPVSSPQAQINAAQDPVESPSSRRRRSSMIRATFRLSRESFYAQFPSSANDDDDQSHVKDTDLSFVSNQLASVAIALTALLSQENKITPHTTVTVEDIFHAVKLPLHFTTRDSLTMHEVYCILSEYISVDPRFSEYALRMSTFDVRRVDNDTAETSTIESCPRQHSITVSDLRSELMSDVINSSRQTLVFYDAYTLLNNVAVDAEDDMDDDHSSSASASPTKGLLGAITTSSLQKKVTNNNYSIEARTRCGLIKDVNPSHLIVHLMHGGIDTSENKLTANPVDTPLKALHTAMAARDEITGRAHGFIVIEKNYDDGDANDEDQNTSNLLRSPSRSFKITNQIIDSAFSQSLLRFPVNCSTTCTPLMYLDQRLATHVTCLALATYLLRRSEHIDINAVVRNHPVPLPFEMICNNGASVTDVFQYYQSFCQSLELATELVPVVRKSRRVGAPSNMSATDLACFFTQAVGYSLEHSVEGEVAVVLSYDLNIVHGSICIGNSGDSTVGYGILAGFDHISEKALIIDPQPKQFTQYWEVSIDRLHQAMTDHGLIIIASNPEKANSIKPVIHDEHTARVLASVTNTLPVPTMSNEEAVSLDVPLVLGAMALSRVGCAVTMDDMICSVPFNISYLLRKRFSMEDFVRVMNVVNSGRSDVVAMTYHCDTRLPFESFKTVVNDCFASKIPVIFNYAAPLASSHVPSSHKNCFALLHTVSGSNILLQNTSPAAAERRFWVSFEQLYQACADRSPITHQSRGFITFGSHPELAKIYKNRPHVDTFKLPTTQLFTATVCPQLAAVALALTSRGAMCTTEEIFYTAFGTLETRDEAKFGSLRQQLGPEVVAGVANEFFHSTKPGFVASTITFDDAPTTTQKVEKVLGATQRGTVIVVYDAKEVHHTTHEAAGSAVIAGVEESTAIVCDAEPTSWPEYWKLDINIVVEQCVRRPELFGFITVAEQ